MMVIILTLSCSWSHLTLHFFRRIKHVLDHAVNSGVGNNLMLPQLKRPAQQWDDDELHGIGQLVAHLLSACTVYQRCIVHLEACQKVRQHLLRPSNLSYSMCFMLHAQCMGESCDPEGERLCASTQTSAVVK